MSNQDQWNRLQLIKQHANLDSRELARLLEVTVAAINLWRTTRIPHERIISKDPKAATICSRLGVTAQWMLKGVNPPQWHIADEILKGRWDFKFEPEEDVAGRIVEDAGAFAKRVLYAIYSAWLDLLRVRLLDELAKIDVGLPIPDRIRIERWRFIRDPFATWIDHLSVGETQQLSNHLTCWPTPGPMRDLIQRELEKKKPGESKWPSDMTAAEAAIQQEVVRKRSLAYQELLVTHDAAHWAGHRRRLEELFRSCELASRDPNGLRIAREELRKFLEAEFENEGACAGSAIVPVLGGDINVAMKAEILGSRRSWIRRIIEGALRDELRRHLIHYVVEDADRYELKKRTFSLKDVANVVERGTGLKVLMGKGSDGGSSSVSSDMLYRELTAIQKEGELEWKDAKSKNSDTSNIIRLKLTGSTWRVISSRTKDEITKLKLKSSPDTRETTASEDGSE